jgi:hypothetical protein
MMMNWPVLTLLCTIAGGLLCLLSVGALMLLIAALLISLFNLIADGDFVSWSDLRPVVGLMVTTALPGAALLIVAHALRQAVLP